MNRLSILLALVLVSGSATAITPNAVELELGRLIRTHAGQKRSEMIHNPLLNAVARAKARDLGTRKFFNHIDPDGFGPNRVIQLVGYELPGWYGTDRDANFVESLSGGAGSAAEVLTNWLKSAAHRDHVLGLDPFWADQTHYGIGYADVPGSPLRRYAVFISAPPPDTTPSNGAYAEWLLDRYLPRTLEGSTDLDDADGDGLSRLQEFALNLDPRSPNVLPTPAHSAERGRLEWLLPLREDLGTLEVRVEQSSDLRNWSTDGVSKEAGGLFSIPASGREGYLRIVTIK